MSTDTFMVLSEMPSGHNLSRGNTGGTYLLVPGGICITDMESVWYILPEYLPSVHRLGGIDLQCDILYLVRISSTWNQFYIESVCCRFLIENLGRNTYLHRARYLFDNLGEISSMR